MSLRWAPAALCGRPPDCADGSSPGDAVWLHPLCVSGGGRRGTRRVAVSRQTEPQWTYRRTPKRASTVSATSAVDSVPPPLEDLVGPGVHQGQRARACRGRRRGAARTPASRLGAGRAGRRGGRRAPAGQPLLAGLEHVVGPLPVGAVVVGEQRQPDRHRVDPVAAQPGDEDQVALGLATSSRRPGRSCRRARSGGRTAPRR